jgi:hypothetical protein
MKIYTFVRNKVYLKEIVANFEFRFTQVVSDHGYPHPQLQSLPVFIHLIDILNSGVTYPTMWNGAQH